MSENRPIHLLLDTLPQIGHVEWIGVRQARGGPMVEFKTVLLLPYQGLGGDRFDGGTGSTRQVTLI